MIEANLGIIIKGSKILLCMKKRWFWVGLWNSAWWKIDWCETMEECMIRELKEETNLDVEKNDLKEVGILYFYFDFKPEWNQKVVIFMINDFKWILQETEEMKPEWFSIDQIPYNQMWKDDIIWLPRIINWEKVEYDFYFDKKWNIANYKKLK